jgi:MoxR-like ATPase
MSEATEFLQYRGNGTTRDGRPAPTPGERGVYLADSELVHAVNAALAVEQPLLVTGDAGTGKTVLAFSIAAELELGEVEAFVVRSDHQGRELLYEIDNLGRFYDAQHQDEKAKDRANYLHYGPLARAFLADSRKVVLIDEIDKAPRDFPNDLLNALGNFEVRIPELNIQKPARFRPIVIITSNQESQLPDPFLRRCVFHHIEAPGRERLQEILQERLGHLALADRLRERILDRYLELRGLKGTLNKTPATSELLVWARILAAAGVRDDQLDGALRDLPFLGALLKTRQDLERVRPRLA